MKSKTIKAIMLLATISLVWFFVALACFSFYLREEDLLSRDKGAASDTRLVAKIDTAVGAYEIGKVEIIDMGKITDFAWDTLYMFGGYTQASEMDAIIGRSWRDTCVTNIHSTDGYTLLVFTKDQSVVHCVDYHATDGFLIPMEYYRSGIARQDALFVLDENGYIVINK